MRAIGDVRRSGQGRGPANLWVRRSGQDCSPMGQNGEPIVLWGLLGRQPFAYGTASSSPYAGCRRSIFQNPCAQPVITANQLIWDEWWVSERFASTANCSVSF